MLRKGSGEWSCLPAVPGDPHDEQGCFDRIFLQWMKDSFAGRTPQIENVGIAYMYMGAWVPDSSGRAQPDNHTFHVGPHIMIVSTHKNQDELEKLNHDGSDGMPYVAHPPGRTDLYRVMANLRGKIRTTEQPGLKVHSYTAPDDGWVVNTHFVELPKQVIAIDAQYTIPYAKEALAYAATLGKPVTRLYVTHYHPDHLLGAAAFGLPIRALSEVKAKIEAVGDRVASEEHEKFPEAIPSHADKPSALVARGAEIIEGIRFEFLHLRHTETEHALMIGFPEHRILITQDLIYNGVHVFISERAFDSWSEGLQHYKSQAYEKILPGHGPPGGKELYDRMLNYLSTARDLLSKASDGDDLKARLIAAFPEFGGRALLDHQKRFLFPPRKEAKT